MNYQTLTEEELLNHQQHFIDFAKNDIEYFKFIPAKLRNQKIFIFNFLDYLEKNEFDPENPAIYSKAYISAYSREILSSSLVLGSDREVVLRLAGKNIDCLNYVSGEFLNDREIALAAIKGYAQDGLNGAYFSHYKFNVFSNEIQEKIAKMSSHQEIISWLESELLYKELNSELDTKNTEKKKVKL